MTRSDVKDDLTIAVVGLGSVGEPLLQALAGAGFPTVGIDSDPDTLTRVTARLGPRSPGAEPPRLGGELSLLATADVVFVTVPDDFAITSSVLREAHAVCGPTTLFATTSARLSLPRLAIAGGRPHSTLGIRLLAPPASTTSTAVEVVATSMTEQQSATVVTTVLTKAGLSCVTLGAIASSDAMGLLHAYLNRAVSLYAEGEISREAIDTAMRLGCGLPRGPLQLLDHIGLDTAHATLHELHNTTGNPAYEPSSLLTCLVDEGHLGRKTGRGFYMYDASGTVIAGTEPTDRTPRSMVRRIGLLGSGVMARGIAEVATLAGFPAVLVARSQEKADSAHSAIESSLTRGVRRGRVTASARQSALALLSVTSDQNALADCDLVVEAVIEDLNVKREHFAHLGTVCKPSAIVATTTSSLSVSACAEASGRPDRVVGMHFFNPAPTMRLVELACARTTSPETAATVRDVCAALGKHVVDSPDRAGYIVNYLLFPYLADAIRLLDRPDVDISATDEAIRSGYGHPMGPFALLDTIGLDVSLAILRQLHQAFALPDLAPPELLGQLVSLNESLGRKTGRGFLQW
ncbi:3-hydroxyacyl-CoA dehydrogenase family protein [Streptomyces sp. NPDC059076]|uniref:3-hydroxyacyl-CoA dehydrogenase family protein n=1 Tax=unclassified Streptomyces TaxID=2593676 RepID=UPI003695414E